MGVRDSFSRLKKKVKHLRNGRKPGSMEPDIDWEGVDLEDPGTKSELDVDWENVDLEEYLPGLESYTVAGDGEGDGADTCGQRACSRNRPPQPDEPEPGAASGNETDQGGGEASGSRMGVSQGDLLPRPGVDVDVVVGCRPGQEGKGEKTERACSRPSTPPILHSGDPDGV